MRDRILAYALAISVGVHLIIICIIGLASQSSRAIPDQLLPIQVSVVKSPDDDSKPTPAAPVKIAPKPTAVPHVVTSPVRTVLPATPLLHPVAQVRPVIHVPLFQRFVAKIQHTALSYKPAGNPGGALNTGSTSSRGENLGGNGRTPVGWVPGAPNGRGAGSGSGEGVGRPEPVQDAVDGLGHEAAPAPAPPPNVRIRVCAVSGMLPGPYCEEITTRSFRPGKEPTSTCTMCHPRQKSVLADRSVPELISGMKRPKYPQSAMINGIQGAVTVEYTIDTRGNVVAVKVKASAGNGDLDEAAVATVKSRKYKPAIQAGIPRSYRKRETFRFALD